MPRAALKGRLYETMHHIRPTSSLCHILLPLLTVLRQPKMESLPLTSLQQRGLQSNGRKHHAPGKKVAIQRRHLIDKVVDSALRDEHRLRFRRQSKIR
jgi:hypothetical protein